MGYKIQQQLINLLIVDTGDYVGIRYEDFNSKLEYIGSNKDKAIRTLKVVN